MTAISSSSEDRLYSKKRYCSEPTTPRKGTPSCSRVGWFSSAEAETKVAVTSAAVAPHALTCTK